MASNDLPCSYSMVSTNIIETHEKHLVPNTTGVDVDPIIPIKKYNGDL